VEKTLSKCNVDARKSLTDLEERLGFFAEAGCWVVLNEQHSKIALQ